MVPQPKIPYFSPVFAGCPAPGGSVPGKVYQTAASSAFAAGQPPAADPFFCF